MAKTKFEKGFVNIPLNKLVMANWNYKDMDSPKYLKLKEKLRNNFKRNGQVESIIVRELDTGFFEICNGNHRYEIMHELEFEEAHCFNMGQVSQRDAERIAIETNETKFETDTLKLAQLLTGLQEDFTVDELVDTLPYDEAEIDSFNKLLDFDFEDENGSDQEKKFNDGGEDPADWKMLRYNLPVEVAEQLEFQIERIKKLLYPEDKVENVSYVLPFEAMIQIIAQTPDDSIKGGG